MAAVRSSGWAVDAGSGRLVPCENEIGDCGDDEVVVRVTHCGLCRGDLRVARRAGAGAMTIPGHEIVGEIEQAGRAVTHLAPGRRVGVGWQSASCGCCEWCAAGHVHLCPAQEETCVGRPGGFASHIKVQAAFAIPLPDALDSALAAPLLCAGIAVFAPLVRYSIGAESRTAVVGIGGAGHLALQFLRTLGCRPDALSGSPSKEQDAYDFGAERFFRLADGSTRSERNGCYDFILVTSAGSPDWAALLRLLRPRGTLCLVGIPGRDVRFPAEELVDFGKSIVGNPIGSPDTIARMLRYAVEHGIRPRVELYSMAEINLAMQRLDDNRARYRIVLSQLPS